MGLHMAEHEAFIAAICEAPDDDDRRLVYADYLQESRDPVNEARAELIRYQIEESRFDDDCARRRRLRHHSRKILHDHESQWVQSLHMLPAGSWTFQRGFVECVRLEAAEFPRLAQELFSQFPIRELELRNVQGNRQVLEAIAASPYLARVRTLRFTPAPFHHEGLGDHGVATLLRSPFLTNLRELSLERQRLSNDAIAMLANCPALSGLTSLQIGHNRPNHTFAQSIDGDAMPILAASPYLHNLTHLDLSHLSLDNAGIEAISHSPTMQCLTDLNVQRCGLGSEGVQSLAASKHMKQLMRLNLRNNRIGVCGALALANSRHIHHLRVLDLSSNRITDAGVGGLVESQNVRHMLILTLRRNQLGNDAARALAKCENLQKLLTLDLRHNQMSLSGGKAIAMSEGYPNLEHFDLRGNSIRPAQKAELRKLLGKKFGRL